MGLAGEIRRKLAVIPDWPDLPGVIAENEQSDPASEALRVRWKPARYHRQAVKVQRFERTGSTFFRQASGGFVARGLCVLA